MFILCLSLFPHTASAQAHSECWYLYKSGYNVRGTQPAAADIWAAMKRLSRQYNVPVEVVAAVSQLESGWKQFAADGVVVHNRTACVNLYRNAAAQPNPVDVGLMQMAGSTARAYDVQRLISDYAYNLEAGVRVLDGKWKTFYQYWGPQYWPGRPMDHDRMVLENWYYPLKAYNGWANLADFTYVEIVYRHMERPVAAADFIPGVRVTRPAEAIPGYTLPPAPGKYLTCFKAFSPGNRFMDGNYASWYGKTTHRGTFGENEIVVMAPSAWRCTTSSLNVRAGPGAGYAVLGTLPRDMTCVANGTSAGWYRLWFNGGYGWCSGSYLARTTGVTGLRVTVSDLNVRSGAGTSYSILGKVHSPEIYIRTSTSSTWSRVNWSGRSGWLSNPYTSSVAF